MKFPEAEVTEISNFVKSKGGNVFNASNGDENLTIDELESLKRGLREALLIKDGKLKSIPYSELWDK